MLLSPCKPVVEKKPDNLVYGLDDKPPLTVSLILALQHIIIIFIGVMFPVLIIHQLGDSISQETGQAIISMSLIAGGVITIIQARGIGPYGSGYLCPSVCGPSYLSASMQSIAVGGLPVMFGMTFFVGLVESSLAPLIKKMRFLFPAEVTGLVVALVGIVVVPIAVKNLLGYHVENGESLIIYKDMFIGMLALAVMIGINVYSKGKLRLFAILTGIVTGFVASSLLGVIAPADWESVSEASWFTLPSMTHMSWKFEPTLIVPFTIAALCSTLKSVGDLATCQKINDAKWLRPDMNNISRGIFADSLGGILSGALGAFGQSTSSSNIGMAIATNSTSRVLAYFIGSMLIMLAFLPKLSQLFIIIPQPVLGATLIFVVSFMIVTGFQLAMSRMLDARKTFVIGISVVFGLSADMLPHVYDHFHPWIAPVFSSSLSLGTVTAVILNLIFRIGIKKTVHFELPLGPDAPDFINNTMKKYGGAWGARPDVIGKATAAITELADLLENKKHVSSNRINASASFDEYNLRMIFDYSGTLPKLPATAPDISTLMAGDCEISSLTGFLVSQQVDEISLEQKGNRGYITMRWDH